MVVESIPFLGQKKSSLKSFKVATLENPTWKNSKGSLNLKPIEALQRLCGAQKDKSQQEKDVDSKSHK